jgi:hypothetical protein
MGKIPLISFFALAKNCLIVENSAVVLCILFYFNFIWFANVCILNIETKIFETQK